MDGYLPVKEIASKGNVRLSSDGGLLPSVKEHGVLVPIEAYCQDNVWYVHDGHCRVTAAVLAGLDQVPYVEVQPPSNDQARIIQQYVINQHRTGLTRLEAADVYRRLREDFGLAQKVIAEKCGVTETEVSIALAAIQAAPEIRDAILEGRVAYSAMRPVLALDADHQKEIAPLVIRAKTARGIDKAVKAYRQAHGLERGIRTPHVVAQKGKADPMERVAADAVHTALTNLRLAETVLITDGQLLAQALADAQQVLEIAKRIERQLLAVDVEEPVYADVENEWEVF